MNASGRPPQLVLLPSRLRHVSSKVPINRSWSSGIWIFLVVGSWTANPNSACSQLSDHMEMFLWFVHLMRLSSALCDLHLLRLHAVSLSTQILSQHWGENNNGGSKLGFGGGNDVFGPRSSWLWEEYMQALPSMFCGNDNFKKAIFSFPSKGSQNDCWLPFWGHKHLMGVLRRFFLCCYYNDLLKLLLCYLLRSFCLINCKKQVTGVSDDCLSSPNLTTTQRVMA